MRSPVGFIAAFLALSVHADPYRCNVGGQVVYQEMPCSGAAAKEKSVADIQAEFERERAAKHSAPPPTVKKLPEKPSQPVDTSRDGIWIIQNQDLISRKLRDPDSAKFRDSFVSRKSGAPVVCGYINGKNAYGAYPGFVRFVGAGPSIQVIESDMAAGEMETLWGQACGYRG